MANYKRSFLLLLLFSAVAISPLSAKKNPFLHGWTARSVLSQPKGFRPAPQIYLKKKYIKSVLHKFHGGASFIVLADTYRKSIGLIGDKSDCQYVYTRSDMDAIIEKAQGNTQILERELLQKPGSLKNVSIMRIDVDNPSAINLRMPSGNEPVAGDGWTPGGHFPNGYLQAVINRVPNGAYTATKIR